MAGESSVNRKATSSCVSPEKLAVEASRITELFPSDGESICPATPKKKVGTASEKKAVKIEDRYVFVL